VVVTYPGDVRIDLHTHSTVSDGTDSPADVVRLAAAAGLDVVGLTDHDSTAGWMEAAQVAQAAGIALVRGAEISAHIGPISVHILAYLHDPTHPDLIAEVAHTRAARLDRAHAMVARIAADYPLTWEDVAAQASGEATIGRPHIADALVAKGMVADRSAAFVEILRPGGPYYVPHAAPDAATAVSAILAAGGVPVFAHPRARMRGRIVTDDDIAALAGAGLAGLEIEHRDHAAEDRAHLAGLAADLGLFATGSSDYHGAGKPNRLGEHTTSAAALAEIAERGALEVLWPASPRTRDAAPAAPRQQARRPARTPGAPHAMTAWYDIATFVVTVVLTGGR
jgi:predicted metal-dependent phosphoesterase TrpH